MIDFFTNRFNVGDFVGESLWIGNLGHFFIVLSIVAVGLSSFSYLKAAISSEDKLKHTWKRIGRWSFTIHGISIFSIFALLFWMILNHHYEYHYAWSHSSNDLPTHYIISSFWEGQEGSFLLWQFWHVIIGWVLIFIAKNYESKVMSIVGFAQFLLATMVLGIHVFGVKIGVNPFTLLRNVMGDAPIFAKNDYLTYITDGNGLNLLLQNYWMVIHPPVLFLGFAATVVPFAYAVASLWEKDYTKWVKPALYWTLFTVGILGTGIFMGGAWAYESLSFGGFWAWDPVENASLVPWLLLVAGLHTLLVYKYTSRSLIVTYLLLIFGFIFILYSTFLTRSGILGDTSVHSFTDLGMTGQLVIYMALLAIPAVILVFARIKDIPKVAEEEAFKSREFWIFIGAIIFIISAGQISFDTSLPVVNKLFGTNLAIGTEVVAHYNKVQIIIACLLAIGSAFVQFLTYKRAKLPKYFKSLIATFLLSIIITFFVARHFEISFINEYHFNENSFSFLSTYWLLLLTSFFALFSNIAYIILVVKGKLWQWTGSISHIGFALFLIGILISQGKQEVISINTMGMGYGENFSHEETQSNILLSAGIPTKMGEYEVSYQQRIPEGHKELFEVFYRRFDKDSSVIEEFYLYPDAQVNEGMGLVSNPDTKHYWTRDIFTHVTSIPEKPKDNNAEIVEMQLGDTLFTSKHFVILEEILKNPPTDEFVFNDTLLGLGAKLKINGFNGYNKSITPLYVIHLNSNEVTQNEYVDFGSSLQFRILKFDPTTETLTLSLIDNNGNEDFIIMKAIVFPYINILWLGGIIMLLGAFLSSVKRYIKA